MTHVCNFRNIILLDLAWWPGLQRSLADIFTQCAERLCQRKVKNIVAALCRYCAISKILQRGGPPSNPCSRGWTDPGYAFSLMERDQCLQSQRCYSCAIFASVLQTSMPIGFLRSYKYVRWITEICHNFGQKRALNLFNSEYSLCVDVWCIPGQLSCVWCFAFVLFLFNAKFYEDQ